MNHPIYKIVDCEVTGDHSLRVMFSDGVTKDVQLDGVFSGELFSPLKDPNFFRKVRVDPEIKTIVWPNGADFDPATLRDWDRLKPQYVERAKLWSGS